MKEWQNCRIFTYPGNRGDAEILRINPDNDPGHEACNTAGLIHLPELRIRGFPTDPDFVPLLPFLTPNRFFLRENSPNMDN